MSQRLYYHLVWTTRDRAPLIDAGLAAFLVGFLRATATRERAELLEIGIVSTHVHVLLSAHQTTNLSRLVQLLKGASSNIARKEGHSNTGKDLRWAPGYRLDSVSARQVEAVRAYVRNQFRRHPEYAIPGWRFDPGSTRPQETESEGPSVHQAP